MALRRGKREALGLALLIFAAGGAGLATVIVLPEAVRPWAAFGAFLLMGVGFAGTSLLPQAMFADALAYETTVQDASGAGAMTGAYNAAETVSGGVGAAAFALVLAATGFISTADGAGAVQPDLAILGIAMAAGLLPALALTIARLPLRHYGLTEAQTDAATLGGQA